MERPMEGPLPAVIDIIDRNCVWITLISRHRQNAELAFLQNVLNLAHGKLLFESPHSPCHHANTLSPIIESISVVMKKIRQKVAGS